MVFQSYALFPHMSVRDNIAFGLKMSKTAEAIEIGPQVDEAARILQMEPLLDRSPQRALRRPAPARRDRARHRAPAEAVPVRRASVQSRCGAARADAHRDRAAAQRDLGVTMVYVTHDQVEAMTLADRIVVLRAGLVEQMGTPQRALRRARQHASSPASSARRR